MTGGSLLFRLVSTLLVGKQYKHTKTRQAKLKSKKSLGLIEDVVLVDHFEFIVLGIRLQTFQVRR